jgi:CheY-like chemotaxis protein
MPPLSEMEDNMAEPLVAVINHEPTFLRLMERLLISAGYRALTIQDGALAYEMVKRDQPQLIILDTWLKSRDAGIDLMQLLRLDELTASIPVLVVSSDDKKQIESKFANVTGPEVNLLFKPFDPETLLRVVKEMLERHHA